jgi:hypothetical protein
MSLYEDSKPWYGQDGDTAWYRSYPNHTTLYTSKPAPFRSSLQGSGKIPASWNLYKPSWTGPFVIGEHRDVPLLAVTRHSGILGRPRLTFYAGSDKKSPVSATVIKPSAALHNKHNFQIIMPSTQADEYTIRKPNDVVEVHVNISRRDVKYMFNVRVGRGWERWTQTFEWRYIQGRDIQLLRQHNDESFHHGLGQLTGGWALYKVAGSRPGTFPALCRENDEIVAVWGEPSIMTDAKATFAFLNSGADGQLGHQFSNLAVITALAIWDEQQRQSAQRQMDVEYGN